MYSQDDGMAEVGRNLWRSSGPSPLHKQGHRESVTQDHVQVTFTVSEHGDSTTLPGHPVAVLHHPHSKKSIC